jgi:peptide methionine sulfoxide reductase MsrA
MPPPPPPPLPAVSYDELLTVLYDRIDPTTLNRQGNDVGTQYRSGIYYHSDAQKEVRTLHRHIFVIL